MELGKAAVFGMATWVLTWSGAGGALVNYVWDCSTNSTVEQLHKKLEFVEHLFMCSHNSTLFS